jgi:hypothetical protein
VVVPRELRADLAHARTDLVRVEKDLPDSLVVACRGAQDAFRSP